MIIEEITIRNWRGYREPHTFRFDEGFNLLVGNNEAGKSTLFEAFTRILFDRHNSRTEEIRQIQPLGSSLGPEATIVFQANGNKYKVRKQFLQTPVAEFYTWRNDRWELDHEGDAADNAAREIFRGEASGRASKPEHRGLSQALWYLQDDAPLPKDAWADGVKEELSGFVSLVARSPDEDQILKKIETEYGLFYTPKKDKIKTGSQLDQLQKVIPGIEAELQSLYERDRGVDGHRQELEGFAEQQRLKAEALKAARTEVDDLKQKISEGGALEEEKKQKEETVRQAEAAWKKIADDHTAIERHRRLIDEMTTHLVEARREAEELQAESRMEQIAAEKHHASWKDTHAPRLQQVEKELDILQAIERTRWLEEQMVSVQEQIERIQTTEKNLWERKEVLSTTPLPTKKDLEKYQKQQLELATLRGQIEQAAIRIGFDLQIEDLPIATDPDAEYLAEENEYLVLVPTTFTVGDLGTIHLRGGGSSLEELQTELQTLSAERDSIFERFGVTDDLELYDLQQRRQSLEQEIKQLKKNHKELTSEKGLEQHREDITLIQQKITKEKSKIDAAPPEWQQLSDDAIQDMSEGLTTEKKDLNRKIKDEQQAEKEGRDAHTEALDRAQAASTRRIELQTQIKGLEQQNADILKSYGTYERLQETLAKETAVLELAKEDLETIRARYKTLVEEPKEQYENALEIVRALEEQMQSIQEEIIDRKARIEEAVSEGFYSRIGDLEASLKAEKRNLNQVTQQAEAAKLLYELTQAFKKEQSTALASPVAGLVSRWLVMLTNGAYDSIQLDERIFPVEVSNSRYDAALSRDCLSYGTREQVIVLLRLAMGVLLSNDERNLVVIDDRLVNADPIRMRRLCRILEEVAVNHCQIVVATCNDTPYAGVRGKVIQVPRDGSAE